MAVLELLKGVATQHLMYTAGLWALLALIPLILVYLIRPRPKKETVPALMFLLRDSAKSDKKSFLRNFVRDPLFILQIIMLIAFAVAIAKPFITVTEDVFVEKTAIVIDASASSQTVFEGKTRFERAIDIAQENVGTTNALIAISAVPKLIADDVDAGKVKDELARLKPTDTPTNIFDSIIFAGSYVGEKDKVIVISDFIETSSQKDFNAAKNILESKGVIVDFVNLRDFETEKARNIGIVDMDVTEEQVSVQIRNFNDDNESVKLSVEGANLTIDEIMIGPKDVEVVNFPTPAALSKFSIKPLRGDSFPVDDQVYISAPSKSTVPLLLISNSVSKHLSTALDVIDLVSVDKGAPPKIPDIAHQIIMISNINKDLILPGTMKNIRKQVEAGAALIVIGQPDLFSIDFQDMLPVERFDTGSPVVIDEAQYISSTYENSITEDVNFGRVTKYLHVKPVDGAIVLATTADNNTMIAMRNHKAGMVVYFGLMDEYSDFKLDIYYPVFWKRLFDLAIKKQDLSELNYKTGRLVNLLEKTSIQAPFGKVEASTIILSDQGIYKTDKRNFVANLLNDDESNINGDNLGNKIGVFEEEARIRKDVPLDITNHFIIGLLSLIFLELLWIKFRGDL
ncbi:MAG: BatA and WFA domain-containing protein [Candidatus Woesearchaeota archaeon]